MSQKRARARRREARAAFEAKAKLPRPAMDRLNDVRAKRDEELGHLRAKYEAQLRKVSEEWAKARRAVWAEHEERRATILKAAATAEDAAA